MKTTGKAITILMADDDQDDCLLVRDAFVQSRLANDLHFVANGEDLMDYLYRRGAYADRAQSPQPGLDGSIRNMPTVPTQKYIQVVGAG